MKKKFYIFLLTFLCLLCGQMGYANDIYGGENNAHPSLNCEDFGSLCDLLSEKYGVDVTAIFINDEGHIGGFYSSTDDPLASGGIELNIVKGLWDGPDPDDCPSGDWCVCYGTGCEDTPPDTSEPEDPVCSEYGESAYLAPCGCIGGDTGIDECPEDETPPGTTEPTCNITSCPTGYILDVDSCECKKDCEEGEYEQAIRNEKIIFTKKYGWVDTTHAFEDTSRDSPIGVNNLWNQLKEPPSASQIYMGYYSVNYKQDIVRAGVSIGIERQFLVSPDLTLEERKSVALAILQNVSTAFELLQSIHPTSTSSFEPADLPSNMLNFYRHVEGLTEEQISAAIEPVSIEQAIEVLRLHPCTFTSDEYKNRSFEPIRFESPYTSQNFGIPDILNTIVPFVVSPATDFGNADLILLEQDIISN